MKKKLLISLMIITILLMPIFCYAEENVKFTYNQDEQKNLENIPIIGCQAVYVAEPTTGKIIYEKNAHERRYPASTTKILTALLVLEKCNLTDTANISQKALSLVPAGYSNAKLQVGEELTIKDLLYALLIPSANEAANVLAEHVSGSVEEFAELCNNRAKELGCEDLHFVNPNGIHSENHYCTAYDLYLIAKECRKYEAFNEIVKTTKFTLPATNVYKKADRTFKNTNELLLSGTYYYGNCTGIKTGFTTPAGQCLVASSSYNGIDLISVVLGGGTNSLGLNERFYDTKNLFEFTYENYSVKDIAQYGDIVANINVGKATKETSSLDVIVDTNISTIVPNNIDENSIISSISVNDNVVAPVEKNQVLGQITYNVDGLSYTTNLIASHSVEKLPYEKYNAIVVGTGVAVLVIFVLLLIIFRKHKKAVILFELIVIVALGVGIYFIFQEGATSAITKITYYK